MPLEHQEAGPVRVERQQEGQPHAGKVLAAIQAHADDIPFFCAGTVAKLISEGYTGYLIQTTNDEKCGPTPSLGATILSNEQEFAKFLAFLEDTARLLATHWGPKQLALQLMTEPGANALPWNELQPRLWQAARRAMPGHTLILAGDQVGTIDGLVSTKPVNDANVLYSFTFYDPFVLTLQGGEWLTPKLWAFLGGIPYPSSPEIIAAHKQAILEKIPPEPPEWRAAAEGMLLEYGNARWNREKIAGCVRKLADWNKSHGGALRIWCAEFGCYQHSIDPEDRRRYLKDVRETFEENGIGWAYWSYNETLTVMAPGRQPFGPAHLQTPDKRLLEVLLPRSGD